MAWKGSSSNHHPVPSSHFDQTSPFCLMSSKKRPASISLLPDVSFPKSPSRPPSATSGTWTHFATDSWRCAETTRYKNNENYKCFTVSNMQWNGGLDWKTYPTQHNYDVAKAQGQGRRVHGEDTMSFFSFSLFLSWVPHVRSFRFPPITYKINYACTFFLVLSKSTNQTSENSGVKKYRKQPSKRQTTSLKSDEEDRRQ